MAQRSKQNSSSIVVEAERVRQDIQLAADSQRKGATSQSRRGGQKDQKGSKSTAEIAAMDQHRIPMNNLLERLQTDLERGLSSGEVDRRIKEDGLNKLTEKPPTPWYIVFLKELTGFFSLLLWTASILCFIGYALAPSDPSNLYLGLVLAIVVFLTGCFSFYQESKSAAIMASFSGLAPTKCIVVRDGKEQSIDTKYVVKGDKIKLKEGDAVPADMRITFSDELCVDNSSLTGESEPVILGDQCTSENDILETKNVAFFGTLVKAGNGEGIVFLCGDNTVIGKIANMAAGATTEDTPIAKEISRFVKIITIVALVLGIGFFGIGFIYYNVIDNIVFAIGIIVANVPEGLLATVTVSLTLTAKKMAAKQVLVKNLEAVETLGSTTCICTDKTGTLTKNKMTVTDLWYKGMLYVADKYIDENTKTEYDINDHNFQMLMKCALLCNKSYLQTTLPSDKKKGIPAEDEQLEQDYLNALKNKDMDKIDTSGDASDSGILKFFHCVQNEEEIRARYKLLQRSQNKKKGDDKGQKQNCELLFNSRHKFALTVHEPLGDTAPRGHENDYVVFLKGAPEIVWEMCQTYYGQNGIEDIRRYQNSFDKSNDLLARDGKRILGFACKFLDRRQFRQPEDIDIRGPKKEEQGLGDEAYTFIGLVALMDPPRDEVPEAVLTCRQAGVKVIMVTGDQPKTAAAIAKQVNIISRQSTTSVDIQDQQGVDVVSAEKMAEAIIIPGMRINELIAGIDDERKDADLERSKRLVHFIAKDEIVFARTSPQHKMLIVQACQLRGHIVAVTGDGVNDSPAIKKADIGIAMGIAGSPVAKDAADMLLLDDNFASIVKGVEEGRLIFDNLKKSIAYTLSSNIPEIGPFLSFIIFQLPLPLSTVLILCVDLGTDMIPAISLAYENSELDIMKRMPRDASKDHLVNSRLINFSYLQIGMCQALAGFYTYFVVMNDYGFPPATLFYWAISEDGAKPDKDDQYTLEHEYHGNSHAKTDEYEGQRVNWITPGDGELDLRVWFYDFDDDNWSDCRFPGKESAVTDADVCYTTEALRHAQCAYFVSIVVVQWADILICKTRKLSIYQQGMKNKMLNFGLFSETALAVLLCYVPPLNIALGTRDLAATHFGVPAMPFFVVIFCYDEIRKYLIRRYRSKHHDSEGKEIAGWLERNTYY